MGSWQYMTDMPYASVSLETTWKLMWMLHMGQNQLVSPDNLPPLEQCKAELKGEVLMATFLYKFFTIIFKKWVLILILLQITLSCKCFQENTSLYPVSFAMDVTRRKRNGSVILYIFMNL